MAMFGQYETVRELKRSGLGVVYVARRAGAGGPGQFVVKVLETTVDIVGPERARANARRFLEAAQAQRSASERGPDHWAPIHDAGRSGEEAYFVTDLYSMSLKRLIEGRRRFSTSDVVCVARAVLGGIRALREAEGRAHGNLKPANVLLGGRGDPSRDSVVLSDPLPRSELDESRSEAADLYALGQIIHEMVTWQAFRGRAVWPIRDGPAWSGLGSAGSGLRDLCNRVLEFKPDQGPATIDEVEGLLSALPTGGGGRTGLVVGVGAILLVMLGAGVYAWYRSRPAPAASPIGSGVTLPAAIASDDWSRLCLGWAWFNTLEYRVINGGEEIDVLRADPGLDEILEGIRKIGEGIRPPEGLKGPDRLGQQSTTPPDPEEMSEEDLKRFGVALDAVDRTTQAIRGWKGLDQAGLAGEALARRGWSAAAAFVEERVGEVERILDGSQETREAYDGLTKNLADLVRARPILVAVTEHDAAIEALIGKIQQADTLADDPTMKRLSELGSGVGASNREGAGGGTAADLSEARDELARTRSVLEDLERFLAQSGGGGRIDAVALARARGENPIAADEPLRPAHVRQWISDATSWLRLDPDPLEDWAALKETMALLQEDLATLSRRGNEETREELASARVNLAQASAALDGAKSGLDPDGAGLIAAALALPRLESREAQIRQAMGRAEGWLNGVRSGVREAIASVSGDPGKRFRAVLAAMDASGRSEAVRSALRGVADRLESESGSSISFEDFQALDRARRRLLTIEDSFSASIGEASVSASWLTGLRAVVDRRREHDLESFIAGLDLTDPIPREGEDFEPGARAFEEWVGQVDALVGDLVQAEGLLDGAYGPGEAAPSPAAGAATAGEVYGRCVDGAELLSQEVRSVVSPVIDRIHGLERLGSVEDGSALIESIEAAPEDRPEAVVAAWRRLGELPPADGVVGLRAEAEAYRRVRDVVATRIADPSRREQLSQESAERARQRWLGSFALLHEDGPIEQTIALMDRFGVDPSRIRGRSRFNYALWNLRQLDPSADDAQAVQRRDQLVAAVQDLDAGESESVGVFVGKVQEIGSDESAPPPIEFDQIGPASAGWGEWSSATSEEGGRIARVTYTWWKDAQRQHAWRQIEFVLVTPSDPAEAFYLSSEEVSLGLFSKVLDASGRWAALEPEFDTLDREVGSTGGIRVWAERSKPSPTYGVFKKAKSWLIGTPQLGPEAPLYAAGLGADPLVDPARIADSQGRPDYEQPMQRLGPGAAVMLARALGCRLPTSAEWQAAVHQQGGVGDLNSYNLRDQTWASQRDHVALLEDQGVQPDQFWPDRGGFRIDSSAATGREAVAWTGPDGQTPDDGRLWFFPVDEPVDKADSGPIRHLVGNVAEWVFDDPGKIDAIDPAAGPDQVRGVLSEGGLFVIGASAMSPPDQGIDEALPVDPDRGKYGFADVGFRLVLPTHGQVRASLSAQLADLARGQSYLGP